MQTYRSVPNGSAFNRSEQAFFYKRFPLFSPHNDFQKLLTENKPEWKPHIKEEFQVKLTKLFSYFIDLLYHSTMNKVLYWLIDLTVYLIISTIFTTQQPLVGHIIDTSRSRSSRQVISLSQRPLPVKTRHSQKRGIHDPGGIRTTITVSKRP